ncbi:hypothetical protein SAMN05216559_2287 [Halomicrobium zhouii]|uniref:Uncharacterized protein n=2 Tax=Halomicrobium zhouii TaxID=767519 RepID=A0A1I6L906_9EURY|nr:hypothetical protein SAMN05216559_2287 [Halomicrobium zhouii]
MQAAAEHPNKKSSALSSVVKLPRYQIETWVDDDGKPDVGRGVETARERGWLDVDVETKQFDALNTLVAAVFSGGTINENDVPAFTPDAGCVTVTRVKDALVQLGAGTKTRGDDDADRPVEVLPETDASVLGRVLVALGAPHGAKNSEADVSLPEYLDDCPMYLRRDFVEIYVWNRGQQMGDGATVQIIEERPRKFYEELAGLIRAVVNGPVYIRDDGVSISSAAIEDLRCG